MKPVVSNGQSGGERTGLEAALGPGLAIGGGIPRRGCRAPGAVAAGTMAAVLLCAALAASDAAPRDADFAAEERPGGLAPAGPRGDPASYAEALGMWRDPRELNAWIGVRFHYDMERALELSETQRARLGRPPVLPPEEFFRAPRGTCVDLTRFAVETLRAVAPGLNPKYVMIQFDPVVVAGNTLRRHWLASFERDGRRFFLADSERPGHMAGPYASVGAFMDEYARYRQRRIVSFREMDTWEQTIRAPAVRRQGHTPSDASHAQE